jgi:putative NADH-flavin reductase
MKVAIFGASGRTGVLLVEKALAAGHSVVAFLRNPAKLTIQHERLSTVQGDFHNLEKVEEAVRGVDAVLTVAAPSRVGLENIIQAMKKHGVRRLISATGAGVPDPDDRPRLIHKAIDLLIRVLSPEAYKNGIGQVEAIRASELDWTIVRAPMLTDQPGDGNYRVGYVGKDMGFQLSRTDLAEFMLKQLNDSTYLRKAPVVSKK